MIEFVSAMKHVEIQGLSKIFGNTIGVEDVSFTMEEGQLVSLLGPSGCGKSTTLRCVAGLERPTTGEIYLGGELVSSAEEDIHITPQKRNIGMVFQSFALWPHKTVVENVMFGLEESPNVDMPKSQMREEASEYLELVDLEGYEDKSPRNLSGGEQQRVALARSLVYNPDIMLMDEPLSNLDAKLRKDARIWLKEFQNRTGITMLYVTHDQAEACALSDEMIVMSKGNIVQQGTPEEIFTRPKNEYVADFMGKGNLLDATIRRIDNGIAEVDMVTGGKIDVNTVNGSERTDGEEVIIAISPEEVSLANERTGETNRVKGKIVERLFYGDKSEYKVDLGDEDVIVMERMLVDLPVGEEVEVFFPPEKCALISAELSAQGPSIATSAGTVE